MIVQLTEAYLSELIALFTRTIAAMQIQGIDQWDELYPNRELLCQDIAANSAYAYLVGTEIAGYIVVNELDSPEYSQVDWLNKDSSFQVIHRLCVSPNYQNQGIAKKLVSFAEELAFSKGYTSIRLDAFSKNPLSLRLYEKLNYQRLGEVQFRKGIFICFEKILSLKDKSTATKEMEPQ